MTVVATAIGLGGPLNRIIALPMEEAKVIHEAVALLLTLGMPNRLSRGIMRLMCQRLLQPIEKAVLRTIIG